MILELTTMFTSYFCNGDNFFYFEAFNMILKINYSFIFTSEKQYPYKSRLIINNNKCVSASSKACCLSWNEQNHME